MEDLKDILCLGLFLDRTMIDDSFPRLLNTHNLGVEKIKRKGSNAKPGGVEGDFIFRGMDCSHQRFILQ